MDPVLSYDFGEIEHSVRREIHATATRLNALLGELERQIAPLQDVWTRAAATAYRAEQGRWNQSAAALNDMLVRLGDAVRDGAYDVSEADRSAANTWHR